MFYAPYESLARAEAEDMIFSLPSALGHLSSEQAVALEELLAGAYGRGLEAGFAMSNFDGIDPAEAMEIYTAGITEGKREQERGDS